ncbi:inactive phospholipase C-like protein 2 isoform X2 [Strigops habroptila]|uniref:inactive phospholipase C-like protein 2 isoform X2 n=1 Tax=Strigops habroptila TaxID=2489341 RepID=UPI0011CFE72A|nr:inactive phospholipase C-like protein 2 isoform X2 [Strigops habroptila]
MAEFGSGGGTGGGGLPSSPGPVHGKVAFKAGDGEGGGDGGGGGGGGRSRFDSAGSRVSNGDCALAGAGDHPGSALPASPESSGSSKEKGFSTGQQREGKPGIPRRSSIIKDGTKQKRERKKTVSFSSMPTEKKISSASDCINAMVEGSELKKIRSNSRVYHRYFLLDADMQSLRWEPSKKDSEKAKIDIKSIKEVRTGKNTDIFRSNGIYDQISEDCAFSIIYGENYESLDLVANSADIANIWVTGLRYLISYGKHTLDMIESTQDNMRTSWLSQMFSESDVDNLGHIPLCNAVQFIKDLNPGLKTNKIELKFKELHRSKEKTGTEVTKEEFIEVFHELCTRPEIYFLLVQFSSNKEFLDTKDLMMFLEAEQGMAHVTEEISLEIIHKYEPAKEGQEKGCLSIDGFTNYLTSPDCHIFDPEHKKVCQDMKQPLSHYFINSSHNTYLIEDQFRGPSDITGYIRALKMGCRSVELDVWDGPDNEPVIYTGHTMTSQIVFRSVIDIINKYAFFASEYPLILCLENHCSIKQQKVMVQHMKKILGDKLHTQSPNIEESYLPSPESLKGKILIKAKKLSSNCSGLEGDVTDEDEGAEMSQRVGKEGVEQQNSMTGKRFQLCKELSELVSICKSVQFKEFQVSFQLQKYWEVCSFNEVLASKYANENPGDFVNYNKRFLARVFPSPMRIDSSNMNPQDFWKCGCQIVAMNFQTPGLMMDLNIGWFRQNGNCGYVLRPAIMREEVSFFSANTKDTVPGVSPQLLHIKIISGQNFPKPKGSGAKGDVVDPYVYVEIHGIPADCAEQRTKTMHQNGDNPIFDESFEFQINLPELAMVRFVVLDDDYIGDEFIGQYTIPFECLQTGYRHVPLQSLTGENLAHASLFVHVAITNRRGGGKPHKRGLSVRKGKKSREYASMRTLWIKTIDEVFKNALQPIRDATDLRENMQMIQTIRTLVENTDSLYEKIVQCQKAAMEFHENLHNIGAREGLKERKLQKSVESFTWNITILKGQADLLKYAKNEALENLKQIHYATLSCGLNKPGTENAEISKPRRSLEVIPEKAGDENGE